MIALMGATQEVHKVHQACHGTEDLARQVDDKCETSSQGSVPGLAAQRWNFQTRQEQCHDHHDRNHQKLNEEKHENNPNDDFHANLPSCRRPQ
jgi:hypothetical protein